MTATPYHQDDHATVLHGDCLDVLRELPDSSVHAIVTDPPYGLANTDPAHVAETITRWVNGDRTYLPGGSGFMGKAWDAFVPPVAVWDECLRVLKPGGHVLAFAGSRTMDLMTLGLRLAGFEIRDSIAWLYGSGFPKSLDVAKAIDKAAGAEREVTGRAKGAASSRTESLGVFASEYDATAPATPDAERWQGWGTALKPAFEPIVVARKPLIGNVACNVLAHGTGALNIDATRTATTAADRAAINAKHAGMDPDSYERRPGDSLNLSTNPMPLVQARAHDAGRWPTNVVLDDTQAAELDRQSGTSTSRRSAGRNGTDTAESTWGLNRSEDSERGHDDEGGASRFFPTFRYEAKAPTEERPRVNGIAHPTVKPLDLMRWLVRLVTPPGGTVLDPFAGSGTTLEAAVIEGFTVIGIEREADYLPLIRSRLTKPLAPVLDLDGLL